MVMFIRKINWNYAPNMLNLGGGAMWPFIAGGGRFKHVKENLLSVFKTISRAIAGCVLQQIFKIYPK